jgi:hypothetical protein
LEIVFQRSGTVIGFMPASFHFPERAELWAPLQNDPAKTPRTDYFLRSIARLKPGVTAEQATSEMQAMLDQIHRENPAANNQLVGASLAAAHIRSRDPPQAGDRAVGGGRAAAIDRLRECEQSAVGEGIRALAGDGGPNGNGSVAATPGPSVGGREPVAGPRRRRRYQPHLGAPAN